MRGAGVAALMAGAGAALGQPYPSKPIRIITATPGGSPDFVARLVAQRLTANIGQQVIVDNRGLVVAIEAGAHAQPDGHTLLFYGSAVWLLPFMRDNVAWNALTDFAPVTLATTAPNILIVHPALPVNSVRELIALAQAKPGEINLAGGGIGTASHLAAELFKAMAGVNIVRVPYKGTGQSLNALIAGEVQVMFALSAAAVPHLKTGRVKALAVTSARPSALVPDLPTIAASGVPGYEAVSLLGFFAPVRTSPALVARLNQEIVRILNSAEMKTRLFDASIEAVASSPTEFVTAIKSEMDRMGKLIRDAGIRDE